MSTQNHTTNTINFVIEIANAEAAAAHEKGCDLYEWLQGVNSQIEFHEMELERNLTTLEAATWVWQRMALEASIERHVEELNTLYEQALSLYDQLDWLEAEYFAALNRLLAA